jgi:outer membrane protein assembly factor BamB
VGLAACGGPTLDEPETLARTEQAHEQGKLTGALRWVRHITGEPVILGEFPEEKSGTLAKDGEEHLVVVYSFVGNIDLGERFVRAPGGPTRSAIALARYDQKKGRLEWLKVFGAGPGVEGGVFGRHVAVDSKHDILLEVGAQGVDFGAGPVPDGEHLLKLDRHGRLLWRRSLPVPVPSGNLAVFDLLTDSHDNVAIAGTLTGTVDLGSGPVSSLPDPAGGFGPSPFLAKFSPEGENLWTFANSRFFGEGLGATVDSQDHFLLCGGASPEGFTIPFVLRLSPDGDLRWDRLLPISGGGGQARDVATHGNRVVLTGTYSGTFTFRGRTVSAGGVPSDDAFLVAYTREGEERWARSFGFSGERVAMDQRDGVLVTGTYRPGDDLGLGPIPGKEEFSSNLYVAKYDRITGEPLWTRGFPAGLAEPSSLVATKDGRSVVLGSFRSGSLIIDGMELPQKSPNDLFLLGLDR